MRRVFAAGGGGGLLASLLAAGWVGVVLGVVVVLVVVGAICWIVNDRDRPDRLVRILAAWRRGDPR